jgi:hypothetical protein
MLWFVIQQMLLSLVLIAIMHYIFEFFKNNLTEPRIKDLVNKPKVKYEQIYKTASISKQEPDMKAELQNYIQELSTEQVITSEDNVFDNNYQTI